MTMSILTAGPLSRFAGARLYHDDVIRDSTSPTGLCTAVNQHPDVLYDVLSLNIGSTPGFAQVPGAEQVVVPSSPISTFCPTLGAPRHARAGGA